MGRARVLSAVNQYSTSAVILMNCIAGSKKILRDLSASVLRRVALIANWCCLKMEKIYKHIEKREK